MSVYMETKKKSKSDEIFQPTERRSYDSSIVDGWQKENRESQSALSRYQSMIQRGDFLTSDDLMAYKNALGTYVSSAKKLRNLNKTLGGNVDNDRDWGEQLRSLNSSYDSISQYYSQWKTADEYKASQEAQKKRTAQLGMDLNAGAKEIEDMEAFYDDVLTIEAWYIAEGMAPTNPQDETYRANLEKYNKLKSQYGSVVDLGKAIQNKKVYLNEAKRLQEWDKLSSVANPEAENYDPEFKQYSGYSSTAVDGVWDKLWSQYGMGYSDLTYEFINNQNGMRDEILRKGASFAGAQFDYDEFMIYDKMNENEISIYNYYYAKDGKEAADKYLSSIRETLNSREASERFEKLQDNTFAELLFGIEAGVDQFQTGLDSLGNAITGKDDYIPQTSTQMVSGMVREDLADDGPKLPEWMGGASLGQIGYDAVTTTTNMLPSILTSTVVGAINPVLGGVAGSALLGASASGNAYQEMLNLGYDKGQARTYAALVGGSEAGLQYLLGGIGKLGGKLSGNAIRNIVNSVDNAFAKVALKLGGRAADIISMVTQTGGKLIGNMASEGFEEGLQEILTPWFKNLATGGYSENVNWSEVAYSSLLGALTAGVMESGSTISGEVKTYKTGKTLQTADISAQRLADIGTTFAADTVAYQLAGRVNENTGAYTIGRLFNEIGAELTKANKADIARELESRGVSAKDARIMVDAMAAVVVGEEFTNQQIAMLEANDVLTKACIDVIVNPNSTVNQRSQGYNQIISDLTKQKATKETTTNATRTELGSQNEGNVSAENTVPTETEMPTQSDYEATVEGKTICKSTGEAVSIKAVASVGNGKMTLRLEDGSEVDSKEIAYSNAGEAYVFETVANLGVDAVEATRIINAFRNSGVEGKAFADGMKLAFEYGYGNFSQQELAQKDFAGNIPRMYINTAYEIGQKTREQEGQHAVSQNGGEYALKTQKSTAIDSAKSDSDAVDLSNDNELSERVAGLFGAEKYKAIQQYILEVLGDQPITLKDGKQAIVDRSDALHIANKAASKKTAQISKIKELVENADLYAEDKNVEHNKFDYFCYYRADVKYGEDQFPVYLNVGRGKNDGKYHIYDITNKIRDTADRINGLERPKPNEGYALTSGISKNSIRNPGETVNKKVSGKTGGVYYTTKDGKVLSVSQAEKNGKLALKDKQSVAVKTAKFLQKLGLGGNYYFFESYVDEKGNRVFKDRFGNIQSAPNGLYYSDGDIYIDINAGPDSHSITLRTLSHELTHMIQQWSAAKYKVIADFLAEQYDKEGRNAYEAAKAKQAELSALRGKFVPFQEAYHEFVADSMSTLFDDGNMYDILTDLKKKDKTLVDYIKKFFDDLAAKVRKLYANAQAETDEGQFVQGLSKDIIYRLQQLFAEALVDASEHYATSEQKNTDTQIGVKMMSRDQNQNVVVDESVDSETVRAILTQIYNGNYKSNNNYFPVLKNTPQVYMDYCHLDADRSFVMAKKKAYKAMQQKNKKQHALGVDGLMYVIENLGTPDYIVYQNVGEYAGNYAAIIISEEREIFAAVQLGEYKDAQYAPNGEKGYYNTLITAFYPNEGYLDNNIFIPENDVVYEKKEDPLQVASGVTPSDRAEESSNNRVPYPSGVVKKNSDRTNAPSNRELLAQALEGVATDVEDFHAIKEYRRIVPLLDAEEAKLSWLNAQIREMSFGKGKRDNDKLFALRLEAKQTQNRIDIYDKQLLKLEATAPLQRVLEREKAKAYKRAEQKGKEAVRKEKERAQAKYDELAAKNTASRKKAVEGRHKTGMRHKIQKIVQKLNDLLLNETKDHHIPSGLKKPVAEALDAIDVAMSNPADQIAAIDEQIAKATTPEQAAELGAKKAKLEERAERFADKVNALKAAYDAIKQSPDMSAANSYDEVISSKIQEVSELIGETPLYDMSLSQLEAVYDMYRMIAKAVSNGNKAFKMARAESISQLGMAVGSEVTTAGGSHQYSVKALDGIKKFDWNNLKPVYAFERIGSKTFTELFNNVRAGEDVWAVDVTEARDFYLEQFKKYGYDKWDMKKKYSFESTTGQNFQLTLEQIMSLYAYSKRDQADDHLRKGGFVFDSAIEVVEKKHGIPVKYTVNNATAYNLSPEILADIVGMLTKEQTEFVDVMQDYLSSVMGAKGNEVSMALYDVKLFKEKHYFPLKSAKQYMFEQNEVAGEIRLKNSGFSKKTQPHASNPVILSNFMDVWSKHVNDMSMYHAFVLPLEDFNRVYNYKSSTNENTDTESVKGRIQNAYGAQANEYILQLIKDLNGGARTDPTTDLISKMTGLFKKGAVFASLSVVVQQPSAIARAVALVDTKYFIGPKIDRKRHKALWSEVKQYAPVAIIKEMGYFDTNMGKSTQDFITGKEYSGFTEKMKALVTDSNYHDELLSKAPALADEIAWCAIWEAVKRETKAKNPDVDIKSEAFLKKVGARFTEVIVKTQVYDSVLSRSGLMRSKDTGMKMLTAFIAEPTTSINMIADALLQGKRGNRKHCRTAIGAVIASQILNSVLVSVVYAGRDDDEDETYVEKYIGTLTGEILDSLNPAGYIPFIKDIVSIVQGYDVERSDMAVVSDLWNAWKKLDSDKVSVYEKVEGFAGSIAQFFGLPIKNIMRDVRGIYQTVMSFVSGQHTTKAGIEHAIKGAVTGKDVSNQQQLYEAYLSGDKEQISRVEGRFKDQTAITSAIRKALRENDPRIKEAAQAVINGNAARRVQIVKEIIAEGHFETKDIQAAINAEIDKLREQAKEK